MVKLAMSMLRCWKQVGREQEEKEDVVHLARDIARRDSMVWDVGLSERGEQGSELPFGDINDKDEALFEHSRKYLFGDYN